MNRKIDLSTIEALIGKGSFNDAEILANKIKEKDIRFAVLGTLDYKRGQLVSAESNYSKALTINPNNVLALTNYSQLLLGRQQYREAKNLLEKLCASPTHRTKRVLLNFGAALAGLDEHEEACTVLDELYKAKDTSLLKADGITDLKIYTAYASVLRGALRFSEAADVLIDGLDKYPDDISLMKALADAYAELDPDKSSELYAELDNKNKLGIAGRWNWSFVELRKRNWKKGWELYESGLSDEVGEVGRPRVSLIHSLPSWNRTTASSDDRAVLYLTEQGIGDQVIFLSVFNEETRNVTNPILICERRMISTYKRSFPNVEVQDYAFAKLIGENSTLCKGVFPIGSLMKIHRDSNEKFPKDPKPFIKPDENLVNKFRNDIRSQYPDKKIIGISWTGGHWKRQKSVKSFTFGDLANTRKEGEVYLSLQYGDVSSERAESQKKGLGVKFITGVDFKKNIDAWLALICACDEIFSVSTAMVHFAGAAGVPTKVLLSEFKGPFIWGEQEGTSLIYASVTSFKKQRKETVHEFLTRAKNG